MREIHSLSERGLSMLDPALEKGENGSCLRPLASSEWYRSCGVCSFEPFRFNALDARLLRLRLILSRVGRVRMFAAMADAGLQV